MNRLRILIAEDEDLARSRLARLLNERAQFDLQHICRNGAEALDALSGNDIDIALLDIEMPKPDGIMLSRQLRDMGRPLPALVFITAHSKFAIDAFGVGAADYLLKPYDAAQLDRVLASAIERLSMQRALQQRARILELMQAPSGDGVADSVHAADERPSDGPGRVMVRRNGRMQLIRAEQVDWIEAEGRKCILHCGTAKHQLDGPLADVARRLGESSFIQLGRSSVVNIGRICELQEMFKGDLVAVMKNGDEVSISRRLRTRVLDRLGGR